MLNKFLDFLSSVPPLMWLGTGFLVLVETFQFVIIISYYLLSFPTVSHVAFVHPICDLPNYSHPPRDSQIYWLGILFFNVMFLLIAMMGFKNTQKNRNIPIYWIILVEIFVLVILFAGLDLKFINEQVVPVPNALFIIGSLLTVFSKILLPSVGASVSHAYDHGRLKRVTAGVQAPVFPRRWFYLFIFISLFCALGFYIPDMHALFDAAYFWERQGTNQMFALAAAYSNFYGGLPGVDVQALYGVGLPVVIGQICKLAGAFDWEMIFRVVSWFIIAYTAAWFVLYTRVFRSPLLALAVWFLLLKFRFLSGEGGALFTFVNWNASPLRFYGDVFFLGAICAHWSSQRRPWLILAGVICALQLFLVTSTGTIFCLLFGIYSFIYVLAGKGEEATVNNRAAKDALLALALGIALYGSIMLGVYGGHLADASLWNNFFIWFKLYRNGMENGSNIRLLFTDPGVFFLSISFITLYLLSLWTAFCLVLQRRFSDVRPMLAVVLSIYGLLHHQHFIWYAQPVVIERNVPIVLFLAFIWYDILIERQPYFLKQRFSIILLLGAVVLLFTDPKWQTYPNIFHPKARLMETVDNSYLKEYFDKTYAFTDDVKLIQELTAAQDRVPIVSEHEMMLLVKSHRKPFFYIFPLIFSDQIGRAWFPEDQIFTVDRLQMTLDQIKNQKPPIIFVERKFFEIPTPAPSHGIDLPLVQVVREITRDYRPVAASPYLIAFRHR